MKIDRQEVWQKTDGRCGYCGCELPEKWQVDHMVSKQYHPYIECPVEINHIDNLIAACKECNHYKREKCIDSYGYHRGYREYMQTFHTRLKKLPKKTEVERTKKRIEYMQNIANKYGITVDKPWCGVFYYETLQNQSIK